MLQTVLTSSSAGSWAEHLWRLQIITVPAHFDERQKTATVEAAMLGGLKRVRLLQGMAAQAPMQRCAFCMPDLDSYAAAPCGA